MGCHVLSDGEQACFYDSVTMTAFGPVMESAHADFFRDWLLETYGLDPRAFVDGSMLDSALEIAYGQFKAVWCERCEEWPCACEEGDSTITNTFRRWAMHSSNCGS